MSQTSNHNLTLFVFISRLFTYTYRMEVVSNSSLNKYETIINEINDEHEKSDHLNDQLKRENNNLILYNLIRSTAISKLCYLNVQIFNNLVDLYDLYGSELDKNALQEVYNKYCKYYVVEVYVTKHLVQKLTASDRLILSIQGDDLYTSKSLQLTHDAQTILEVFPVDASITNCIVDAFLVNMETSVVFKLDFVHIDVSYHFDKYNRKSENKVHHILQLSGLYNEQINASILKNCSISYEMQSLIDRRIFIEILMQNAYHNLSSMLSDKDDTDKSDFAINMDSGFWKIELTHNRNNRIKIKGNYLDVWRLKRYFFDLFYQKFGNTGETFRPFKIDEGLLSNLEGAVNIYNKLRLST
ncbi:unnamed protein product [Phyllotreta striolata]|uniref:Uncharacterized protein n=1 Tax=Phyllotreta striolata TaxID=444603 RepID=A0A9N9TKM0_PHYSR|nr:unnamed protein product [Phyllotreta striolata]